MATAPQPCLYPYPQAGIALTVLSAWWAAAGPASSTAPSCAGAAHPLTRIWKGALTWPFFIASSDAAALEPPSPRPCPMRSLPQTYRLPPGSANIWKMCPL
jgi:hypothetical protein